MKNLLEGDSDQPCEMSLRKVNKTSPLQWSCKIFLIWVEAILSSMDEYSVSNFHGSPPTHRPRGKTKEHLEVYSHSLVNLMVTK